MEPGTSRTDELMARRIRIDQRSDGARVRAQILEDWCAAMGDYFAWFGAHDPIADALRGGRPVTVRRYWLPDHIAEALPYGPPDELLVVDVDGVIYPAGD